MRITCQCYVQGDLPPDLAVCEAVFNEKPSDELRSALTSAIDEYKAVVVRNNRNDLKKSIDDFDGNLENVFTSSFWSSQMTQIQDLFGHVLTRDEALEAPGVLS